MGAIRIALFRLYAVAFTSMLALVAVNSALTSLLHPERVPVAGLPGPLPWAWAIMYGVGGLLILTGVVTAKLNIEGAGCMAFMGGAVVNAISWALVWGSGAWNTVILLVMFAMAAGARLYQLLRRQILVLVPEAGYERPQ